MIPGALLPNLRIRDENVANASQTAKHKEPETNIDSQTVHNDKPTAISTEKDQ
jgi:hypothetical protein